MKNDGTMQEARARLAEIVGERNVSDYAEERYIYSRDMGTMDPSLPDLVGSADHLQQVFQKGQSHHQYHCIACRY